MLARATRIGPRTFHWGDRTYIMGILNMSPDSFSGDGIGSGAQNTVEQALRLVADGADMIDIGGESTRPGAPPVDEATELSRILPAIAALALVCAVPVSVDTSKPAVARAALAAGATIVNDVHGLRTEPAMAAVIAEAGAAAVVMANLREPGSAHGDAVARVLAQLRQSLRIAEAAGIPHDRVIVDPGFGFGTTPAQNLEIVRRLRDLRALGHPMLVGPSRKSTIGAILGLPVNERMEGTSALVCAAIERGVDLVRVHDVRAIARAARMTDALVRGWPCSGSGMGSP